MIWWTNKMLQSLFIENLVIVKKLSLDFQSGLSVLSGETGAGKSILIDALGLTLGNKTDKGIIRVDSAKAEVSATFDITQNPLAKEWLETQELNNSDDDCIIRRVLVKEGRSKAFINSRPVPLPQLQSLGELLLDIHGQHEHQLLLRTQNQRHLLDTFADHPQLTSKVKKTFQSLTEERRQLKTLTDAAADRANRIDYLRFQINDLQLLNLDSINIDSLNKDHKTLAYSEELNSQTGEILEQLQEDDKSVHSVLSTLCKKLDELTAIDPNLADCARMLNSATIDITETIDNIRNYQDRIEIDPQRLQQMEETIAQLHEQARKHRLEPHELKDFLNKLETELTEALKSDETFSHLQEKIDQLEKAYKAAAKKLTKSRRASAEVLAEKINKSMPSLGLKDANFHISIKPAEKEQTHGADDICFEIAANLGQSLAPLAKTASGGELSRISLAIQVATANCGEIPTLIFDEIDVGIGGAVAETVGKLLRELGKGKQVLCVTHLAQVASQGHQHFKVAKHNNNNQTLTQITELDKVSRIEEIARMSGGSKITEQTLAHAEQLINTN